jgi:hypothetical protein
MSIFLSQNDLELMTGKKRKSCQIESLRGMGIAFYVNASGRPVVPVSSVNTKDLNQPQKEEWKPAVLKGI